MTTAKAPHNHGATQPGVDIKSAIERAKRDLREELDDYRARLAEAEDRWAALERVSRTITGEQMQSAADLVLAGVLVSKGG